MFICIVTTLKAKSKKQKTKNKKQKSKKMTRGSTGNLVFDTSNPG